MCACAAMTSHGRKHGVPPSHWDLAEGIFLRNIPAKCDEGTGIWGLGHRVTGVFRVWDVRFRAQTNQHGTSKWYHCRRLPKNLNPMDFSERHSVLKPLNLKCQAQTKIRV